MNESQKNSKLEDFLKLANKSLKVIEEHNAEVVLKKDITEEYDSDIFTNVTEIIFKTQIEKVFLRVLKAIDSYDEVWRIISVSFVKPEKKSVIEYKNV